MGAPPLSYAPACLPLFDDTPVNCMWIEIYPMISTKSFVKLKKKKSFLSRTDENSTWSTGNRFKCTTFRFFSLFIIIVIVEINVTPVINHEWYILYIYSYAHRRRARKVWSVCSKSYVRGNGGLWKNLNKYYWEAFLKI